MEDDFISPYEKSRNKINSGIEMLIEVIVTPGPNELVRTKLHNYAMKILNSNMKPAPEKDNVFTKMTKQLAKININASEKTRADMNRKLQAAVHKLSQMKSLKQPTSVMKLLCSLSKSPSTAASSISTATGNSVVLQGRPPASQSSVSFFTAVQNPPPEPTASTTKELLRYLLGQPSAYYREPSSLSLEAIDVASLRKIRAPMSPQSTALADDLLVTAVKLRLLRSCSSAAVGRSKTALATEIAKVVADVDRHVDGLLQQFEHAEDEDDLTIEVNLKKRPAVDAIARQSIVAVADSEFLEDFTTPNAKSRHSSPSKSSFKPSTKRLPSLFDIWQQLADLMDIVNCLCIFWDSCAQVPDFHCISVLGVWRKSGNTRMKAIASEMIHAVSLPFIDACLKWANESSIADPDFMVEKIPAAKFFWEDHYRLNRDKIPFVFDAELANMIFFLGSNRFLMQMVTKTESADDLPLLKLHRLPEDRDIESHKRDIQRLYAESAAVLVKLYTRKSGLMKHINFLKGSMFMEKGDFVDSLLVKLTPMLDLPAEEVFYHDIMPLFDELAKKSTLSSKDSSKVLGRLGVKILEGTKGDNGWDVFCMEYNFPDLLKFIFNPDVCLKLMRMWHHLFKIKKMIFRMNEQWLEQKQLIKKAVENKMFYKLMIRCNIIRTHMSQFLQNLGGYIFYEVIESQFSTYVSKAPACETAFDLRALTHALVDDLLRDALIDRDEQNLFRLVSDLLHLTDRYLRAFSIIKKYGLKEVKKELVLNDDFPLEKSSKMIASIWESYSNAYQMFLNALDAHPSTRALAFKFDFNQYHMKEVNF